MDYSSREQDERELRREIELANVICLVYAMDDDESKHKLASYWMPKLNEIEAAEGAATTTTTKGESAATSNSNISNSSSYKRPVVIVANKLDKMTDNFLMTRDTSISKLIGAHAQIETCVNASAKTLKNVPELFYYAQKAVLYPTAPIYDVATKRLTAACVRCLTRIFKLCDRDNDAALSDDELNDFQLACFGVRLNAAALQEVKSLLNTNEAHLSGGAARNHITLAGFLHLNLLFVKKGRQETTWIILKHFGYDRHLAMSREYLSFRYLIGNHRIPSLIRLVLIQLFC